MHLSSHISHLTLELIKLLINTQPPIIKYAFYGAFANYKNGDYMVLENGMTTLQSLSLEKSKPFYLSLFYNQTSTL